MLVVTGIRETIGAVGRTVRTDGVKMAAALDMHAQKVLVLSRHYCPKETEALADSGRVVTTGHGFVARSTVEYGGESPGHDVIVDYGNVVHNNLEAFHEPPTCAMFLTRAVVELVPEFSRSVTAGMRTTGPVGVQGPNREDRGMRG